MSWCINDVYKPGDIAILNINDADYRCIINEISKRDTVKVLQNGDLTEERGVLKKRKKIDSIHKMGKIIITFGDIEVEKHNTKTRFQYTM